VNYPRAYEKTSIPASEALTYLYKRTVRGLPPKASIVLERVELNGSEPLHWFQPVTPPSYSEGCTDLILVGTRLSLGLQELILSSTWFRLFLTGFILVVSGCRLSGTGLILCLTGLSLCLGSDSPVGSGWCLVVAGLVL